MEAATKTDADVAAIGATVLDYFGAAVYHEYAYLVRTRDRWKIANALWELT